MKLNPRPLLAVLSLAAVAVTAACSDHPYAGKDDPPFPYPNIAVEEEALRDNLKFDVPIIAPSSDASPMRVTVPVRNIYKQEVNIQYRFEFLDKEHRPLGTNLGWMYLKLPVRVQVAIDGSAMESQAADWRLVIRSAR